MNIKESFAKSCQIVNRPWIRFCRFESYQSFSRRNAGGIIYKMILKCLSFAQRYFSLYIFVNVSLKAPRSNNIILSRRDRKGDFTQQNHMADTLAGQGIALENIKIHVNPSYSVNRSWTIDIISPTSILYNRIFSLIISFYKQMYRKNFMLSLSKVVIRYFSMHYKLQLQRYILTYNL